MASDSSTAGSLPKLSLLDLTAPHSFVTPAKRIHEGTDVSRFLTSFAYRDIGIFILQLNHALVPRQEPDGKIRTFSLPNAPSSTPSITALQGLLKTVESYIDEAPPDPGPRRFGNVSFRKWHELLDQRIDGLLSDGLLAEALKAGDGTAKKEVASYFKGAWGSSQRLDYGTGHELSFLAFLGCLWKLGYFNDGDTVDDGAMEREVVLAVVEPYLSVVRKLILTYTLEPAGSHGVWGLDDHSFLPYVFGSAQLTRPISSPSEPTPLEGSVRGAPRPSAVTSPQQVEDYRRSNMYFAAVGFINDVKKGPFWEHSPILFDISGIKDGWGKINKGMIKMFNAEVLSKFPVVQHFPFGSLFSWDQDPTAPTPTQSVHMANQPTATGGGPPSAAGTAAPWAQATRMPAATGPGVPYSRVAPGPSSGSLSARPTGKPEDGSSGEISTEPQITMTKAPWAK